MLLDRTLPTTQTERYCIRLFIRSFRGQMATVAQPKLCFGTLVRS